VANRLMHPNYCEGARCMFPCTTTLALIGFTISSIEPKTTASKPAIRRVTEASVCVQGACQRC
jgi:hypothetical protein